MSMNRCSPAKSELQTRRKGQMLLAGSIMGPASGEMQVSQTGQNTKLSQILRLVEQAQKSHPVENVGPNGWPHDLFS